jgi:hypothetical protein
MRLVVESKLVQRKISMADLVLLENEKAKEALGPIKNLICAVDAQSLVYALQPQKHRLSRDSTFLFTWKGMGIIEMVNEQFSPIPRPARPISQVFFLMLFGNQTIMLLILTSSPMN